MTCLTALLFESSSWIQTIHDTMISEEALLLGEYLSTRKMRVVHENPISSKKNSFNYSWAISIMAKSLPFGKQYSTALYQH